MKITIIEKAPFEFAKKEGGGTISGIRYSGWTDDGTLITFSANTDDDLPVHGGTRFNPEKCVEVELDTKVWNGTVKYRLR